MAKIMSLIYREWILMRKKLLLGLVITAGLLLLITFIGFSYQNGAFDGNEKLCNLFAKRGGYFEVYPVMLLLTSVAGTSADAYESDIKSNWARYSLTLPAETRPRALAHVLFMLIRFIVTFLILLAVSVVSAAAFGKPFAKEMIADIGIFSCLALLPICLVEFFMGKARDPIAYKKQQSRIPVAFAACGTVVGLLLARTMKSAGTVSDPFTVLQPLLDKYVTIRHTVQPFIIPVFIGLLVLVYVIAKRNLDSLKQS